jgi:hypothetical protein
MVGNNLLKWPCLRIHPSGGKIGALPKRGRCGGPNRPCENHDEQPSTTT